MIHAMKLNDDPFQKMKSGKKTVELRLFDNKRRSLDINDDIIFSNISNETEEIAVRIVAMYRYESFAALFAEIAPEKCGFEVGISSKEAAEHMRLYYSAEEEFSYGVIGIKIELIDLQDTLDELERQKEANFEHWFPDGMK